MSAQPPTLLALLPTLLMHPYPIACNSRLNTKAFSTSSYSGFTRFNYKDDYIRPNCLLNIQKRYFSLALRLFIRVLELPFAYAVCETPIYNAHRH